MRFKRSFQDALLDLAQARQAAEAAAQAQPGQVSWSPRLKGWKIFQAIFQPSDGGDGKARAGTTKIDLDTDDDDDEPGQVEDPETLRILLRSLLSERKRTLWLRRLQQERHGSIQSCGAGKS